MGVTQRGEANHCHCQSNLASSLEKKRHQLPTLSESASCAHVPSQLEAYKRPSAPSILRSFKVISEPLPAARGCDKRQTCTAWHNDIASFRPRAGPGLGLRAPTLLAVVAGVAVGGGISARPILTAAECSGRVQGLTGCFRGRIITALSPSGQRYRSHTCQKHNRSHRGVNHALSDKL